MNAQNGCLGIWKTIDHESNQEKSLVEIYEQNGKIFGKVVKFLPASTLTHCNKCPGDKNNKPLLNMDILWGMQRYKDYWSYGEIVDPKSGKVYKCSIWLEGPNTLKVRGYIGLPALGRTQTWERVK